MKTDLDLLVERELNGILLFGFDTYKDENSARADSLRKERDTLEAETAKRGLTDAKTGALTPKGAALDPENDPRVLSLAAQNRAFIRGRLA